MILEVVLILFFTMFSILLARLCWRSDRGGVKRAIVTFWGLTLVIFIAAAFGSREPLKTTPPEDMPISVPEGGYITSQGCRSCHPAHYKTWHASYHRTMTQLPSHDSVIGDFDNAELEVEGIRYKTSKRADDFLVSMEVADPLSAVGSPRRTSARVTMTTGSHHMQIYWRSSGDGRKVSLLPIAYLRDQQRWIPREATLIDHTGGKSKDYEGLWNHTCILCHATNSRPRITDIKPYFEDSPMDSHVSEFGISCEACHGPGEQHAKLNRDPRRRYDLHFSEGSDESIVNPSRLTHVRSSQVCGQCHSVRTFFNKEQFHNLFFSGSTYRPGDDLDEHENLLCAANESRASIQHVLQQNPERKPSTFWDDWSVRVTGREYNGLIESPCFQRGEMSCLSCHTMHKAHDDPRSLSTWANDQLGQRMESNHACIQCHKEYEDEEYVTGHTHHGASSSGSSCYNCHMPHTTYGLLKSIRSHEIDVPRVSDTLQFRRPNACNLCHLDKSLAWSADALHDWYGQEVPEMTADEQNIAASVLWALKGDAGVRALAACAMELEAAKDVSGTDWMAPYLAELMKDPYDAIRLIAYRVLKELPEMQDVKFDEFAAESERNSAVKQIVQSWREKSSERKGPNQATLLNEHGTLSREEFQRLLKQRDHRPVLLAE